MIEFGEKLKTAREEKGMTQQTLANSLYVTRQAVSRWECGARYPDLLTAKKLSEILVVSLDELLSGEETAAYSAESPITTSQRTERIQSALYAFAGMAYLLMSILYVGLMLPLSKETPFIVSAYSIFYMMRYMLIAALLFYGLICSIQGKLTVKKAGLIAAAYFVTAFIANLFVHTQAGFLFSTFFQTCIYFICAAVVLNCFYYRKSFNAMPIYFISLLCLIKTIGTYIEAFHIDTELSFVIRTIGLAAAAGLMVLISYQSHILSKHSHSY